MAEFNQFGSVRPGQSADAKVCAHFEAMLTEAVDGSLSAEDKAAFDLHLLGCAACREMLAGAQRGAAWMQMLRQQAPVPPAAMLERILAQTSGARALRSADAAAAIPGLTLVAADAGPIATTSGNVVPFRRRIVSRFDFRAVAHTLLQPRLAMTAAMAFFSIALTLNLTGVRLSGLHASDLKPSSLRRSIYEANAHVVRYYTNLRVVYELESRVRDLQRSSDDDPAATPAPQPQTGGGTAGPNGAEPSGNKNPQEKDAPPKRRVSPGTSRREPMPDGRPALGVLAIAGRGPLDIEAVATPVVLAGTVDFDLQERGTA